jgi:rubrerythrin
MQKDRSYHEAAIQYNEELEEFAAELAERLQHEEVARWARSVSKQHHFHAGRHKKALAKFDSQSVDTVDTEDGGEDRIVDDERVVHRSAVDGEWVSKEFAEKHPKTTTEEHVDMPVPAETPPVENNPTPGA